MTFSVTALPVGQGDAFLLRIDDRCILIDGGMSGDLLVRLLNEHHVSRLNIVVCTHNDADHAKGLIGLLNDGRWRRRIDEIWLPGVIRHALSAIVAPTPEDADELFTDCIATAAGCDSLERLAEADLKSQSAAEARPDSIHANRLSEHEGGSRTLLRSEDDEVDEAADVAIADAPELDRTAYDARFYSFPWFHFHGGRAGSTSHERLFASAVEAAWRVRQLAVLARESDVHIRWFDHDEFTRRRIPSGGESYLRPLNSVEARYVPPPRPYRLLDVLRLSVANQHSLVFESRTSSGHAGVIFCADSDLRACDQPSALANCVITAPHHGSEDNRPAYDKVANWPLTTVRWLRSDGRFSRRPGATFLALDSDKYCTRCRNRGGGVVSFSDSGAVRLDWNGATWVSRTATCTCT